MTFHRKSYPHLGQITDQNVEQALRLLWDRVVECEQKIEACETVIAKLKSQAARVPIIERVTARQSAKIATLS